MKKLLFTLLVGITSLAFSQAPQQISYQGVARNASGTVLANQPIGIKFDIHQGSASGSVVFTETHTGVTTNSFGLFTTYIGSISNLGVINWSTGPYFIEVSIDPNTGTYSSLGAQQLMSVPYALNAGSAPAPAVSFTNNILSVGGNTTTIPGGTTYTAGTGINIAGSTITNTAPDQTITITPAGSASVTGVYPNFIISTPVVQTYTAGTGIDITGGVISNTAAAVTPTIVGTGATTVNGTYPNLTINTPTVAPDQIVSITGVNSATVTGAYPNFTVNVPVGTTLPNALSGQFLYHTGTVWDTLPRNNLYFDGTNFGIGTTNPQANFHVVGAGRFDASVTTPHVFTNTLTVSGGTLGQVLTSDASGNGTFQNLPVAQTPTITSTGIAVVTPTTGNTFNVDVPVPVLSYTAGTNVLSLSQGTTVTTATLNGTGSNTVSIVGSGLATVTPTTGSIFTVSVPNPTLSVGSGSISISGGNSVAIPSNSTTLVQGNNVSLNQSGNTYTVSSVTPTLNVIGASLTGSYPTQTLTIPASSTTSLTQGSNIIVTGSAPNYTVSTPAYSISLPGGNVAQITNGISTSTAAINATSLTLTGTNNNILSAGGNTVALNTYTTGTGVVLSGTAPNYTLSSPNQSLTINSNSLSITGGNTITIPTTTINGLGTGIATVTTTANNFTVNVPTPAYAPATGVLSFGGTNTVVVTPTLSLSGTTLTSGPATNSVSLAGLNGIYGGSGSIQTGSTTVTVGTNTLTFLSGTTANKPIANFFGGGITGTHLAVGHIGANNATIKLLGSVSTTPVDYGYVSGSTNGIAISGGTSSNGLYATNNAEVGVGTYTTGTGKFVITHTATQADPTMHLRETSGALSRIKFSNTGVANKYFEVGASNNAANNFSAYSVSFFDGTSYKSRLLIYGDGKTSVNNMHSALTTFHVMDDNVTSPGIAAEGFGFSGQINLTRNNPLGVSPTYTRGAVFGGQEIGKINFSAYDGTGYGDGAKIYAKTSENVTNTSKGTDLFFAVVPNTTNNNQDLLKLGNDGIVTVNPNNLFNKAALDVKGRLRVDSSLTMTAYNTPPNTSFVNEGRIYYDRPTNKFKVSENGGAYVDLIPGLGTSPWSQSGLNIFTTNSTDKVGIGTNTPSSKLQVENTLAGDRALYLYQAPSTTDEALFIDNRGNQQAAIIENNNSSNTSVALLATSNGIGGAIRAQNTSTANTTDVLNVSQVGQGNASYFSVNNGGNSAKAIEAQHNGNGSAIGAANSGLGRAGEFAIQNASNNSSALYAATNGGGNAIYAINTNSSNISSVIQASSNSSGVAIYANNTGGPTAQFDNNTTSATFNALNSSSGLAIYASANTGKAIDATSAGLVETISSKNTNASTTAYAGNFDGGLTIKGKTTANADYALRVSSSSFEVFGIRNDGNVGINVLNPTSKLYVNSSNTTPAIYSENIVSGSFANAHGISGKVSFNTHALAAAVFGNNAGAGPSIYGVKNATDNGIAGRFQILNSGNTADAVLAQTDGSGYAMHVVSGTTVNATPAQALWIENGHIKASGTNATSSTTVTSISTSTVIGNDVVGKISITTVATAIAANQEMIKIQFAKPYAAGVTPNVIITPSNANAAGIQGYVSVVSNTGFSIFFNVATAAIARTYTFNYMVIE